MGANRRNKFWWSRRFSVSYRLEFDDIYFALLAEYNLSKLHCQKGKPEHLAHVANIKALKQYLNKVQKDFKHS